jgi:hypothetical protein
MFWPVVRPGEEGRGGHGVGKRVPGFLHRRDEHGEIACRLGKFCSLDPARVTTVRPMAAMAVTEPISGYPI